MKVKVCGITNFEDALLCAECGADYLGFIFYEKSKRYVNPDAVANILKMLPVGILKVGVFVNAQPDEVNSIAERLELDYIQLSGDESAAYTSKLNHPVIKAFRVGASFDYNAVEEYEGTIPLLDTLALGVYGGTGKTFDWGTIPVELRRSIILSGGISIDNVAAAYQEIGPKAVDISSSLESIPGKKDEGKVRSFFNLVNDLRNGNVHR